MKVTFYALIVTCALIQLAIAADGKNAKDTIGKSDFPKMADDVDLDIPLHYRRKNEITGVKEACIAYYDHDTGEMTGECCRRIIYDRKDKYVVESGLGKPEHCHPNHTVSTLKLPDIDLDKNSVKLRMPILVQPGVCNNYHGVGNNACNIYTSGAYSYVWCVSATHSPNYDAEVYRGAAGIDHAFNITNIPAGSCPGL